MSQTQIPRTSAQRRRPTAPEQRPSYRLNRRGKIVFTVVPLVFLFGILTLLTGVELAVAGVEDGSTLGADAVGSAVTITTDRPADAVSATINEQPLTLEAGSDGILTATLPELPDGTHTLVVTADRLLGAASETRSFTLDTTPPTVEVLSPTGPVPVNTEVMVEIAIDDPDAAVTIDGSPVEIGEGGTVTATYPEVPDRPLTITATDDLGNVAEEVLPITLLLPGEPGAPPMIGVHATGWTWVTPVLKDPIMQLIEDGLINTVQLDLKDEAGDIWYDTEVELAHEIGAVTELYDLEEVVDELHDLGVRVVGRLTNFRDPRLANYAIETGQMDWVVQNPDGTAYGQYGGFTNPFNAEVREYSIALAEEAALAGFDDILYDYVRRPDTLSELVYPGQDGTPSDAIVSFLAESLERVNAAGARLGASVFGIAATRPDEIAQDIPRISEVVDYVAPMVYASHWGPGEYGVDNPNAQPYDITYRSLLDFMEITDGTRAHVVAWLQDFSLGVDYGPAEVRAQIDAARDAGVDNFLLWDPATTYTRDALVP